MALYVGASNARRYFPKGIEAIELQLDHLAIQCQLRESFWEGRGEIYDPRLCAWLESKRFSGNSNQNPIPLSMIPSGPNSFRLKPITSSRDRRSTDQTFPAIA